MNVLLMTSAAPRRCAFSTGEKRPPLGLGFLMSILRQQNHQVFFSDEYLKPTRILDNGFLARNRIDLVGIYANTICYGATLRYLEQLQKLREAGKWRGRIAVGGPHTSVGWREIPEYVDHVVIGEGEKTILGLANGGGLGRVIHGEAVEDLDALPRPAYDMFAGQPYNWVHEWYDVRPLFTMNTSRGCPYNCTFCSVKSVWGKTYRYMSAERVVDDIEYLMKTYGARGVYFREDHFTLNKTRVVAFCELLLKRNIQIEWFCETRVDQLADVAYQKLMKAAGCRVFYVGVESGSPRMLEYFKKGETVDQFIRAFDVARQVGIKTYASFVVQAPHETSEDRRLTDEFIERLKPDYHCKNVYVGIPGSELYDFVRENRLYEYEDPFHVLYLKDYLRNAIKYYGFSRHQQVYTMPGFNYRWEWLKARAERLGRKLGWPGRTPASNA